jgi:hypothetical protein
MELSEEEIRLEKANIYKALLSALNRNFTSIFALEENQLNSAVSSELCDFIRLRLRVLIGMEAEKSNTESKIFTKDEITALKDIAGRLLNKNKPETSESAQEAAPSAPKRGRGRPKKEQAPSAAPQAVQMKAPAEDSEGLDPNVQIIEREVVLPNGKVVIHKMRVPKVTQPIMAAPRLSPQEIANLAAQGAHEMASHHSMAGGAVADMIQQIQPNLIEEQ